MSAISIENLAEQISDGWKRFLVDEESQGPRGHQNNVYASNFSPCARKMAYQLTPGHELPAFEPETLAKFRRGNDRERSIKADLAFVGRNSNPPFEVISQQKRFELRDRQGRIAITGKVDGEIYLSRDEAYPFEVKSWSPNITQGIHSFQDLFENKWTRTGAYQLLAYMYGASQAVGFMVLDRSGIPAILKAELWEHENHKRIDEFLDNAERAMDAKETGQLPDFVDDPSVCKMCDFCGVYCNPPKLSGAGGQIILDGELAAALDRRAELQPASDEFKSLDTAVKEKLRGVEMGICGNWLIEGKYGKLTRLEIPEEIKRQYQVVDPKGKFSLKFTQLK